MSKRAEQKALEAYPVQGEWVGNRDINSKARENFQGGYEKAEKDFIALVKQYLAKGERCMNMSENQPEYNFWDGFHNCAENILRELEEE